MGANRVKGLIKDNKDVVEDVGTALIDQVKEKTVAISKEINRTQADDKVGFLDIVMGKILSRKLLVFITATSLLVWAGLDSDIWGMIAMCYIGGQSAIDFAKVWKGM
jgi:hypothetical protein